VNESKEGQPLDVDIDLIKPSPYQPRLFFELADLKDEIERDGLLSALVVRERDEHYELLDGERRLRALRELGWKRIPVDVRDVDDVTAKRSVFKLNLVRQNYNTEEKARYFKKLADEGAKPYQIGMDLNIDDHWVRAHVNVFLFPDDVQQAVWADQFSVAAIRELEPLIGANLEEATIAAREAIARKLTKEEIRQTLRPRLEEIERARVEAAQKVLQEQAEKLGARAPTLETPEDYERAAEALKKEAKRKAEEAMTPEEKAALEAEKQAKAEAQAVARAKREEDKGQQTAKEESRRQERADKKARAELKADKTFLQEGLKALPYEERLEVLGMVPSAEKPKQSKTFREQLEEVIREASQLLTRLDKLRADPRFEELDLKSLKSFALDLYMLADGFTELTHQMDRGAGEHGEKI